VWAAARGAGERALVSLPGARTGGGGGNGGQARCMRCGAARVGRGRGSAGGSRLRWRTASMAGCAMAIPPPASPLAIPRHCVLNVGERMSRPFSILM
jgi:hypothetical protein